MKINLFNYIITIKKKKNKIKRTYGKLGKDVPIPPSGYVHRWIRSDILTNNKWRNRNKNAFTLVKANDYKQFFPHYTEGKFKGCIGVGGLVLVKIPERFIA